MRRAALAYAVGGLLLLGGGCATSVPPVASAECTRWFARLDTAVDAAGVRDAQDEPIPGFPGLRVDRLGMATRGEAGSESWLARAAALDRAAREAELANLPVTQFPIDGAADASQAQQRSQACRDAWPSRLAGNAAAQDRLRAQAQVPDRYATAQRALGLYPLLRWPFLAGAQAWQVEQTQSMARWAAEPPTVRRFVPETSAGSHAPVFEIEAGRSGLARFDRFGAPVWTDPQGRTPGVDAAQPVVYLRETQTLYRGRRLRQLVYTLWFPERPPAGPIDILAGVLDGVVVRLTLGPDGAPLLLDTIHACGCYHLFFPASGVAARPAAPAHEEPAFVAATLPRLAPGERLVLRIASATHDVREVARGGGSDGTRYTLRDEAQLRSLPLPGGGRRSLYGPDGLVPGTERAERFLFWPMGVASAGATRQWGHHATAFVGRRHFDDADLIERYFTIAALE